MAHGETEARFVAALRTALHDRGDEEAAQPPSSNAAASSVVVRAALVRAPGRVNLIGEHIDYHGAAVLPMALEQHVAIAVGTQPGRRRGGSGASVMVQNLDQSSSVGVQPGGRRGGVTVQNLDQERYPGTHTLALEDTVEAGESLRWIDYIRCALQGVLAHPQCAGRAHDLDGLVLVVHGSVPPAAGLSSSSALVVAAALAFLWALRTPLPPTELARLCIDCERLIGTAGGGMDQSASLLAQAGQALFIEFLPTLAATPVPLPEDAVYVIANSLVVAEKAKAAYSHYNLRVVEGRLAVALMGKALGLEGWASLRTLHALEAALTGASQEPVTADRIRGLLHPGAYTLPELQAALETADLVAAVLPDRREAATLVLAHNTEFRLRDRVLHVLEEARRVQAFRRACEEAGGASSSDEGVLESLGALMDASHASCRDLYECSHPELDALVAACRRAGAKGARLTGAGWGGCCVSLVQRRDVDGFVDRVWLDYYVGRKGLGAGDAKARGRCLFVSTPGPGAGVVEIDL